MTKKKGIIFETLGTTSGLRIVESQNPNEMLLQGIFGICGIKNGNNRIYEKSNYGKMVGILQEQIANNEAVLGELEHPNTMNITLENVSHKIEDIQMNEDGTVTGTIRLLDTPKGKIAKAIIEGGAPLYISSRGAGSIDESGKVTLTMLKTYDLVGTPGFSQAKLTLKTGQKFESLNESQDCWMIIDEGDDKKDDDLPDSTGDDNKEEKNDAEPSEEKTKTTKEKTTSDDDITMKDLQDSIEKLTSQVEELKAELHIVKEANEDLMETCEALQNNEVNYNAIQQWIEEEYAPEFRKNINEAIANGVQKWITEEFAQKIQDWVVEEYSGTIQKWIVEEYSPNVDEFISEKLHNWIAEEYSKHLENWITEEFAPVIQKWITEEYSGTVQNWIVEEYSSTVNKWFTEQMMPEYTQKIEESINKNLNEYLATVNEHKFDNIDHVLEKLSDKVEGKANAQQILTESQNNKYAGIPAISGMPVNLRPLWEGLSDKRKEEIIRESRMYDFTKPGVMEKFWASRKLTAETVLEDLKQKNQIPVQKSITESKYDKIFGQAAKMRHV